jgi:hypothetical protein
MVKNDIFAAIGLPLLRLPLDEIDQHEEIVRQLSDAWHQRRHILETGLPPPKPSPCVKRFSSCGADPTGGRDFIPAHFHSGPLPSKGAIPGRPASISIQERSKNLT